MTTKNCLTTIALACARVGLPVFPCAPYGKNPATPNGFHDATTDLATTESHWAQNPNFNIGIRTGTDLDGRVLVVIDVDPRNGGDATLAELLARHGPLPKTARVTTGRRDGGKHYYFVCPPDVTLKSKLGPGIDVQSRGKYVIAPPSIHPDTGLSYEWDAEHNLLEGASIAAIPQWIIDMCSQEATVTIQLPARGVGRVYVDDDKVRDLRSALMSMRADDYELWVRMGLALKELGEIGRGLWMEWSSQSEKFDPRAAALKWESFK